MFRRGDGLMVTVKTQANCLLAGVAAAAAASYPWAHASMAADFVHHVTLAATVGGLADWWGVTALFKRPLGIGAPGTDVLRKNYERLTQGLADFVSNDLLSADNVLRVVEQESFAVILLAHFEQAENQEHFWQAVRPLAEHALSSLNTQQVEELLQTGLPKYIASLHLTEILVDALERAVSDGSLDGLWRLLTQEAKQLLHMEEFVALLDGLAQLAQEEYNKDSLLRELFVSGRAAQLTPVLLRGLEQALDALADSNSELRRQVDNWLLARLEERRHDIALADWINNKAAQLVTDKARNLQQTLLVQDVDVLRELLQRRLAVLQTSSMQQQELDVILKEILRQVLELKHDAVYNLVMQKLADYDRDELIVRMEQRVGDDLQNIRKSGTIIGGLLGGLLFVLAAVLERLVG